MVGIGQSCNHKAATVCRIEKIMRNGLTSPSCTSSSNEWLPCRKEAEPTKFENLNFNRKEFSDKGKHRRLLISTPKINFEPLASSLKKKITLK